MKNLLEKVKIKISELREGSLEILELLHEALIKYDYHSPYGSGGPTINKEEISKYSN